MKTARKNELKSYDLLDTPNEALYDDIVFLAKNICRTPIALLSFMDEDRQWIKAKIGIEATELSSRETLCGYALMGEGALVVEDTTKDERFRFNKYVTGEAHLRFYAGIPILSPFGHPIGVICVMDTQVRKLEAHEYAALLALSRQVVTLIEMRRNNKRAIEITQLLEV